MEASERESETVKKIFHLLKARNRPLGARIGASFWTAATEFAESPFSDASRICGGVSSMNEQAGVEALQRL